MPGFTPYVDFYDICSLKQGDASVAVDQLVGQQVLEKLKKLGPKQTVN